jgi:hypothetical protein
LDTVGFAETDGFEVNAPRKNTWHYRDWVIRSLNSDLSYKRFVRLQIAGDIIEPNSLDGATAVGFLVAGIRKPVDGVTAERKAEIRHDELEELAGRVSQTFLGLSINCARCHDHKFDPISSREYYQVAAALDGVRHGERKISTDSTSANKTHLTVYSTLATDPAPMRIYRGGDPLQAGEEVAAGGLKAIAGLPPSFSVDKTATDGERRLALAHWITDDRNAIFHRAIVNRVWNQHYGFGLVNSPNDLGFRGGQTSHSRLIDWLAIQFREQGYSLKALHRMILSSATFQ